MQAWNPHLQGDIDKIEKESLKNGRTATRIPTGFGKFEYEERLKRPCLTTLKDSRLRSDLIEIYKVMSSGKSINWAKLLNKSRLFMSILRALDAVAVNRIVQEKERLQGQSLGCRSKSLT